MSGGPGVREFGRGARARMTPSPTVNAIVRYAGAELLAERHAGLHRRLVERQPTHLDVAAPQHETAPGPS